MESLLLSVLAVLGLVEGALLLGFAIFCLVAYVASIVWAYRDGEQRGKDGILVALLVALVAWPLGLVVWALVRPASAT